MKFCVKKGVSFKDGFKAITDFLSEEATEYSNLKGDMNVYVTLSSDNRLDCPLNSCNFIVTTDGTVEDVDERIITETKERCVAEMERNIYKNISAYLGIEKEIEKARDNLSNAQKNGFSTISKWEEEIKSLEKRNQKAPEKIEYYNALEECISSKNIKWLVSVERSGGYSNTVVRVCPKIDPDNVVFQSARYYYKYESCYGGRYYDGDFCVDSGEPPARHLWFSSSSDY